MEGEKGFFSRLLYDVKTWKSKPSYSDLETRNERLLQINSELVKKIEEDRKNRDQLKELFKAAENKYKGKEEVIVSLRENIDELEEIVEINEDEIAYCEKGISELSRYKELYEGVRYAEESLREALKGYAVISNDDFEDYDIKKCTDIMVQRKTDLNNLVSLLKSELRSLKKTDNQKEEMIAKLLKDRIPKKYFNDVLEDSLDSKMVLDNDYQILWFTGGCRDQFGSRVEHMKEKEYSVLFEDKEEYENFKRCVDESIEKDKFKIQYRFKTKKDSDENNVNSVAVINYDPEKEKLDGLSITFDKGSWLKGLFSFGKRSYSAEKNDS